MSKAIQVRGLKKSYGDVKAVKGIDFDVEEGSLFAFLGVNGAGKSTTINILCTLLTADAGDVKICGRDLDKHRDEIRSLIGVVFQGSVLDRNLSVKDNLLTRASFYGMSAAERKAALDRLSDLLDLDDIFKRKYGKLSGGQRRRVDVARGLINSPSILFLDEPTTGLDPQTRKTVWEIIDKLRKTRQMTVFLTTHYMEEAAEADSVVILDDGRIVAQGTPVELKNKYSNDYIKLYIPRADEVDARLCGEEYRYNGRFYEIKVRDSEDAKRLLLKNGDIMTDFEVVKGNMDDVFLNVTGRRLTGGE